MAFRFWRRIRLAPGVTLNLGKSGASLSFGPRGAKYTIGPRGRRATVGVPGTGLFYTVHEPRGHDRPQESSRERLSLGFFERLVTPRAERAFVDGLKALAGGDDRAALERLEAAKDLADALWLAGMLQLKRERLAEAERCLGRALDRAAELGTLCAKYGVEAAVTLPVTPEVSAHVWPRERGTLLALAEVYQLQGREDEAIGCLERLLAIDASDPVVLLSLIELALEGGEAQAAARRVVRLTAEVENETPVHAALLLYKARALSLLGLDEAAAGVLTVALRRRKGRSPALLRQIRYERALRYQALGRKRAARRDLERLYAEAPDFEDVAERVRRLTPRIE